MSARADLGALCDAALRANGSKHTACKTFYKPAPQRRRALGAVRLLSGARTARRRAVMGLAPAASLSAASLSAASKRQTHVLSDSPGPGPPTTPRPPPRPQQRHRPRRPAAARARGCPCLLPEQQLLSTEGVYSRDMGRGNIREVRGGTSLRAANATSLPPTPPKTHTPSTPCTPATPRAFIASPTPPLPRPPVLTGHVSSLPPVLTGRVSSLPGAMYARGSLGTAPDSPAARRTSSHRPGASCSSTTCISTGGGMRRVQLVREEGRDASS